MEKQNNKKRLNICVIFIITILLIIIGVLIGIIINNNNINKTDDNNGIEQNVEKNQEDKKESNLKYDLTLIVDGAKKIISIDKQGKVICKEMKSNEEYSSFNIILNESTLNLLDLYFDDFTDENSSRLYHIIKKVNNKYELNINLDESKDYQSIIEREKKGDKISSEFVGYDYYLTKEIFGKLYGALSEIYNDEKDQKLTIGLALQQYR